MSNKFPGTYSHWRVEELVFFVPCDDVHDELDCIKLRVGYSNEEGERLVRLDITVKCMFFERADQYETLAQELCEDGWHKLPPRKIEGEWALRWFKDIGSCSVDMSTNEIVQSSLVAMHALIQQYVYQEETYYLE